MGICILTLPVKDVAKLASGFQIMVIVALNACVIVLRRENPNTIGTNQHLSHIIPIRPDFWNYFWCHIGFLNGRKSLIGAVAALILGFSTYKIMAKGITTMLEMTLKLRASNG